MIEQIDRQKKTEQPVRDDLTLLNRYRPQIMGFAALWILYLHTGVVALVPDSFAYAVYFFTRREGYLGVDIFFLLSGIGLVASWEKTKNIPVFWGHRIRRILIPMLIMAVVNWITIPWDTATFFKTIIGWQYYMVEIERAFLWYYFAAMTFYFFFPFYYMGLRRTPRKWMYFILAILVWLAVSLGLRGMIRDDFYKMTNRIPVFLTGIQLGSVIRDGETGARMNWLFQKGTRRFSKVTWIILAAMTATGLFLEYQIDIREMTMLLPYPGCALPAWLVAVSLSFLLARLYEAVSVKKIFGNVILKLFGFFGKISYEFYCVQVLIFDIFVGRLYNTGKISVLGMDVQVFVLSVAFGWLLYRLNGHFWKWCSYIFPKKE